MTHDIPTEVIDELTDIIASNVVISNWATDAAFDAIAKRGIDPDSLNAADKLNEFEWQFKYNAMLEMMKFYP